MATQALDSLGYQIDAPSDWTVRKVTDSAYAFRIPSTKVGGVSIMAQLTVKKLPRGPASVDDAAKSCAGTIGDKQTLPSGAFYYTCTQQAAGQTIADFDYIIVESGGAIHCTGSGADLTATLAACKTLRKKT